MNIELTHLAVQNRDLFAHLATHGAPATIDALAATLGRDRSNFRKTLKALEGEGWLLRGGADEPPVLMTPAAERALLALDVAAGRVAAGLPPLTHAQIFPDPHQPRKDFESLAATTAIGELAKSIAERGLLQPIRLRMARADTAMIEVGESRWRAIGLLIEWGDDRWPADRPIPYTLAEAETPTEILLDQLVENVQRRGLHPLEEAAGYRRLRDAGISVVDIAAKVGKDRRTIEQRLDLLNLPPDLAERMRLPKDDDQHLTTARAREMLQHLRRINEQAEQRDIEEIAPGGIASPEDEAAARKVRLEPLDLLTLGEIAAAVMVKPSTRFPHSPHPVAEVRRDGAIRSDRLTKLTLAGFATLLIDLDQEDEPSGVRMEPLGHIRLRLEGAHPADNSRALFHLRREAGFSADQARNLANLGRYVATWLNPAEPARGEAEKVPVLFAGDELALTPAPRSARDRAERFSDAVHAAALAANRAELGDPRILNAKLSGRTTVEGETWPEGPTETLTPVWDDYPRVQIRLTTSDTGRWHVSLRTEQGGPSYSGQSSPPYVYSLDDVFRSREDALAYAAEAVVERLGEVWGRKRKLVAWLDSLQAQTDREIEEASDELDLAQAPTRDELAAACREVEAGIAYYYSDERQQDLITEARAAAKPAPTVSDVQLRILLELQHAQLGTDGMPAPVGSYWLDLDAIGLWKTDPPLIVFAAPPGGSWGAHVTEAGEAFIAAEMSGDRATFAATTLARIQEEGPVSAWLRDPTPARLPEVSTSEIMGAMGEEDEDDNSALLAQVREQLATGRPDFPALLQAIGLGGTFRVSGDAEIEVCFDDTCGSESVCVVDHWREHPEDLVTARTLLVEWALKLAANQVQLTPPEGGDTPDAALYRAARATQDFLLRAIPPASPLFMEAGAVYEPLSIALNKAIWAADHPRPVEEPAPRPEPLLALHAGDLVSIGGTASAYRLIGKSRTGGHSPSFLAQQVMLKTGKDYGEPRTITLHAIQALVPAKAVKETGK